MIKCYLGSNGKSNIHKPIWTKLYQTSPTQASQGTRRRATLLMPLKSQRQVPSQVGKNNKDTQQQLESSSSAGQAWSGFSKLKFFNGALYSYESKWSNLIQYLVANLS